jgi:hypothetical protein
MSFFPRCWPLTNFLEFLGHDDLFWNFDNLAKEERKMKRRSRDLGPLFGPLFGFLGICNGKGTSTHGFTHVLGRRIREKVHEV